METKHTPGPYYLRETYTRPDGDHASLIFQEIPHEPSKCIGILIQSSARSREEAEATARLFAASPDLLDILPELLEEIEAWRSGLNSRDMNKCKVGAKFSDLQKARAAIAKARGG